MDSNTLIVIVFVILWLVIISSKRNNDGNGNGEPIVVVVQQKKDNNRSGNSEIVNILFLILLILIAIAILGGGLGKYDLFPIASGWIVVLTLKANRRARWNLATWCSEILGENIPLMAVMDFSLRYLVCLTQWVLKVSSTLRTPHSG